MPAMPASSTNLLLPEGCAGDAGDDAEDRSEAVVYTVDGVADPPSSLGSAFIAARQHLLEKLFWVRRLSLSLVAAGSVLE